MTATNPTTRSIVNSALDGSVGGLTLLYGMLQSDGEYLSMLLQNSSYGNGFVVLPYVTVFWTLFYPCCGLGTVIR